MPVFFVITSATWPVRPGILRLAPSLISIRTTFGAVIRLSWAFGFVLPEIRFPLISTLAPPLPKPRLLSPNSSWNPGMRPIISRAVRGANCSKKAGSYVFDEPASCAEAIPELRVRATRLLASRSEYLVMNSLSDLGCSPFKKGGDRCYQSASLSLKV